jgi:hypothetical protein
MTPRTTDDVMQAVVKDYMNQQMLEARNYRLVHGERPLKAPVPSRRSVWSYVFFWRHSSSHA